MTRDRLNAKQEMFAQRVASGDSLAEAYRQAGYEATGEALYVNATTLSKKAKVALRIDQIVLARQRAVTATQMVTAQTITNMLMETYRAGLDLKQVGAAATAAMGLAKLHGLLVDKTEDVTRRAARSPDAPVEIEVESWLIEQGVDLSNGAPSPESRALGFVTDPVPAGDGAPLPEPRAAPCREP